VAERLVRVCSVLPNRASSYSLRTTQRSHCAYLPGVIGRPASSRNNRDSRDVPTSNTRLGASVCTSRANDHALRLVLRCGLRGANTLEPAGSSSEKDQTHAAALAKAGTARAEGLNRNPSNIIRRFVGENEALAPRPRISARPAYRSAHALRFNGAPVRAMRTAGTDGVQVGVWKAAARPVTIHPTPCVIEERGSRPFRTVSRAAASRRRATTSTSTVVVKPALLRSGGVAPRRAHNAQTACSTQASATSAFPVFVARVRASNDRAPATPAMAGGPDHQLEVA
jgi:hypothetical protein